MDRTEILKQVNEVFTDVLDNNIIILSDDTKAGDIEEWDSLNHIQLVVAIERKFGIRFTSRQIQGWTKVGEMIDAIRSKVN
jgi:acyl carrier protein